MLLLFKHHYSFGLAHFNSWQEFVFFFSVIGKIQISILICIFFFFLIFYWKTKQKGIQNPITFGVNLVTGKQWIIAVMGKTIKIERLKVYILKIWDALNIFSKNSYCFLKLFLRGILLLRNEKIIWNYLQWWLCDKIKSFWQKIL